MARVHQSLASPFGDAVRRPSHSTHSFLRGPRPRHRLITLLSTSEAAASCQVWQSEMKLLFERIWVATYGRMTRKRFEWTTLTWGVTCQFIYIVGKAVCKPIHMAIHTGPRVAYAVAVRAIVKVLRTKGAKTVAWVDM